MKFDGGGFGTVGVGSGVAVLADSVRVVPERLPRLSSELYSCMDSFRGHGCRALRLGGCMKSGDEGGDLCLSTKRFVVAIRVEGLLDSEDAAFLFILVLLSASDEESELLLFTPLLAFFLTGKAGASVGSCC